MQRVLRLELFLFLPNCPCLLLFAPKVDELNNIYKLLPLHNLHLGLYLSSGKTHNEKHII